jgi:alpha-1,6-mannosyltransferase
MGVEAGVFSPSLRSPELRASALQSLGLDRNATLLIGIGRLSSEKRWDMVIRAVEEVANARQVGLLLVGDGSRRSQLKRLAERCGRIDLLPPLTDRRKLARLFASADALVHGCEAETFCMVAAEARASGIPLIVPDRGAAPDQFVGGAGGVYRAGDQRALQRAINDFIDGGAEQQRMRAMRHSDVRTIEEHFGQLFARYSQLRSEHRVEPSHARSIRLVADCHTRQLGGRGCVTAPIT